MLKHHYHFTPKVVEVHIYPPVTGSRQTVTTGRSEHTFHCNFQLVFGGIRTYLEVSSDPMFLWISSKLKFLSTKCAP